MKFFKSIYFVLAITFCTISINATQNSLSQSNLITEKLDSEDEVQTQGPFVFVDEDPRQLIDIIQELTGKIVLQPTVLPAAKINFSSKTKLTTSEAIIAFESILSLNGIGISPVGDKFLKVFQMQSLGHQAPSFITGSSLDLKESQTPYTKFFSINYLDIDSITGVISKMLTPSMSSIVVFSRSNSFLVSDTLLNIQRIERLLTDIDKPNDINEITIFIPLVNILATDLKKRFDTLSTGVLKKHLDNTFFEADERTNQLIVVTHPSNEKFIKEFSANLDKDADPVTKTKVITIQNADASEVSDILNQLIKGQAQSTTTKPTQTNTPTNNNSTVAKSATVNNNPTNNDLSLQFSSYVTIVPDVRTNSIVAYGTNNDLKQIENLIKEIDIVLMQVKIDVVITEVTLTDDQVSGLSTFQMGYNVPDSSIPLSSANGASLSTNTYTLDSSSEAAFTLDLSLKDFSFDAIFNVSKENERVSVLSSPSITTTHNKKASIVVSEERPVITGSLTDTTNTDSLRSTYDYKTIGIELYVTPKISSEKTIQLEIEQIVDHVIGTMLIDGNSQPIIGHRQAESFLNVANNEVVVLAGLQQVTQEDTDGSVFLLGDIPLIGSLFRPEKRKKERTELIIFIRPTLIESKKQADFINTNQIKNSASAIEIRNYFQKGTFIDEENAESLNEHKAIQKDNIRNFNSSE